MKKNIYQIPYLSVTIREEEDVICTSGDTDVPFIQEGNVDETWVERTH